jgi:hypothetical protein
MYGILYHRSRVDVSGRRKRWLCCKYKTDLLKWEEKKKRPYHNRAASIHMASFSNRDPPPVCEMVSALGAQLSRSGRDDG